MYSGQLDVIVAAPLTERFLLTVNWTGAADYKTAPRFHWRVQPSDTEVAGYVRQVKEFYQVSGYQVQHSEVCRCFVTANSFFTWRSSSVEVDTSFPTTNRRGHLT